MVDFDGQDLGCRASSAVRVGVVRVPVMKLKMGVTRHAYFALGSSRLRALTTLVLLGLRRE